MSFRLRSAVFAAVLGCTAANAQPTLTGSIELRDAVAATLNYNPALTSFPLREEALQGQRQTADLRPPLRFGAEAESVLGTGTLQGIGGGEIGAGRGGGGEREGIYRYG